MKAVALDLGGYGLVRCESKWRGLTRPGLTWADLNRLCSSFLRDFNLLKFRDDKAPILGTMSTNTNSSATVVKDFLEMGDTENFIFCKNESEFHGPASSENGQVTRNHLAARWARCEANHFVGGLLVGDFHQCAIGKASLTYSRFHRATAFRLECFGSFLHGVFDGLAGVAKSLSIFKVVDFEAPFFVWGFGCSFPRFLVLGHIVQGLRGIILNEWSYAFDFDVECVLRHG